MHAKIPVLLLAAGCSLLPAGCASRSSREPESSLAGVGRDPELPKPKKSDVVKVPKVVGWRGDATPVAAPGLAVNALARGFEHPRWLYVLPNGDVLVAETNAPERPDAGKGEKSKAEKRFRKRTGTPAPSANRITLLRDADGDGVAEKRSVFLAGLNSPFGMALVGENFYVANTDAILRFSYHEGDTELAGSGEKIADLPAGPRNHFWTRNIIATRKGDRLFATVGANSDVAENGLEPEEGRAAIYVVDLTTGHARIYATGLRNPVGLDWQPESKALWTTVNERDGLGNDLVPDYLTSVTVDGFYGWPYSYFGRHVDKRVKPPRRDLVSVALKPDYALGAHTAPLGLAFYEGSLFPAHYAGGAFIAQHGSWNRQPPSGYRVVFVPFSKETPSGQPEDVLTGFLNAKGEAQGRPSGVVIDRAGALLVADDAGNVIWRVVPAGARKAPAAKPAE